MERHTSYRPSRKVATSRVAILEDDREPSNSMLVSGLREFGFDATAAGSAAELYRLMLKRPFDMVVLDIGPPDEDSLGMLRNLREISDLGIVMLSGKDSRAVRIRALSEGADAYLARPIDVELLAASLRSLARRLRSSPTSTDGMSQPVADAGRRTPWRLESNGWRLVSPAGASIDLTVPERSVLHALIAKAGTPVNRETLIAMLTRDVYDFDPHRLDMLVHRLRRKIAARTREVPPLLTARRAGYLFVARASHRFD